MWHKVKGITFLQIFVPDKLSALAKKTNLSWLAMTPLYKACRQRMAAWPEVVDTYDVLKGWNSFQYTDTHLSTAGAFAVAKIICARLGETVDAQLAGMQDLMTIGDILRKLFPSPPAWRQMAIFAEGITKNGILIPELVLSCLVDGKEGLGGSVRCYHNSDAPIDRKIVCFGNSFFGLGDASNNLTWIMARLA